MLPDQVDEEIPSVNECEQAILVALWPSKDKTLGYFLILEGKKIVWYPGYSCTNL